MSKLVKDVEAKGFHYFDWNVSSGDAGATTSSDKVYSNVVNHLKSDVSVVLQHDTKSYSVNAVERIIKYGIENGYTFKALDENSFGAHHGVNN
jgi:peptidoglycan/xylan/chitin deacetylase (PgdA/CDA1 family)